MKSKFLLIILLAILSVATLAVTACSSSQAATGNPKATAVRQVKISAQLNGDSLAVPVADIEKNINTRFAVNNASGQMYFMAYQYEGQTYVRADICPPCGSQSFTLTNGTLICDSCGTVFDAKTGTGIRGACVRYSKQSVQYKTDNGNLVMNGNDLLVAYQNTLKGK